LAYCCIIMENVCKLKKRLSQQGARALSSLMNSLKSVYISTEQQCMLYQYYKIMKRLEIYICKLPSSPYKKAVGTFLPIFKTNLQKRLCITSISWVLIMFGYLRMHQVYHLTLLNNVL
jgi:hypothetical protein